MNSFSTQQLNASNEVVNIFEATIYRWGILLAQMQSGKTETYLRIACELLTKQVIDYVVIFSGNAETELADQIYENVKEIERNAKKPVAKSSSFWPKYLQSKESELTAVPEQFRSMTLNGIKSSLQSKISIVWGTELNGFTGPFERTLFIWDEAHFAQNLTQRPDKFLKKIGISANGDSSALKSKGNLMLTVSATPFSELSDYHHLHQEKFIVKMLPGANYIGVKQIKESKRLISYTDLTQGLKAAFKTSSETYSSPKYCVIRISKKSEELVIDECLNNGWHFVIYDSVSKCIEQKEKAKKVWNSMDKAPKKNTAILIRGMCRMGKNMQKSHLSFVFETASNSATDTVLQGLLGRTCGYSDGSDRVKIYLSNKIIKSEDIERYIELWDTEGVQIIPRKANNVGMKLPSDRQPIIPIRIKRSNLDNDRKQVIADVLNAFDREPSRIENKNTHQSFDFNSIRVFYLDESKKHRGTDKALTLQSCFEQGIAKGMNQGSGAVEGEVNIWCPKRIPNFDTQYVYVTLTVLDRTIHDRNKIPETTKKEIFAHRLENGQDKEANGGFTYFLPAETATNEATMQDELDFLVNLSNENQSKRSNFPCSINSCYDSKEQEYKGILVSDDILLSLENGDIYQYILNKFNKKLVVETTQIKVNGFNRLMSINW